MCGKTSERSNNITDRALTLPLPLLLWLLNVAAIIPIAITAAAIPTFFFQPDMLQKSNKYTVKETVGSIPFGYSGTATESAIADDDDEKTETERHFQTFTGLELRD